jgi:hypothetical protein
MTTQCDSKWLFTPAYVPMVLAASSGERVWLVAGPNRELFLTACGYLSTIPPATADSPNPSKASAIGIAGLLSAFMSIDIDIVARVQSGEFISVSETAWLSTLLGRGEGAGTWVQFLSSGLEFVADVAAISEKLLGVGAEADRYARRSHEFFASFADGPRTEQG